MSDPRSIFRICLASTGLLLASGILMSKVGLSVIGCDQGCTEIGSLWFSWIFLFGLFAGNIAYVYCVRQGNDQHRFWLALGLGGASIVAFFTMALVRSLCPICVVAQILWLAIAIDSLSERSPRLVFVSCILLGACAIYAIRDSNRSLAEPATFVLREYEQVKRGAIHGAVIFSDPYCAHCRGAARMFDESRSPLPVVYRWKLLSQSGDQSTRLVAAIESAMQTDAVKGAILRREILTMANPSDHAQLQKVVAKSGFKVEQFDNWLKYPEAKSLDLVRRDGNLAKQLWIETVPCLGILLSSNAANSPTVRVATKNFMKGIEPTLDSDLSMFDVYFGTSQGAQ